MRQSRARDGRNLADPATTISRHHGDTELGGWAPQAARIEVEEEGALGPSLENAALMFAHGNAAPRPPRWSRARYRRALTADGVDVPVRPLRAGGRPGVF